MGLYVTYIAKDLQLDLSQYLLVMKLATHVFDEKTFCRFHILRMKSSNNYIMSQELGAPVTTLPYHSRIYVLKPILDANELVAPSPPQPQPEALSFQDIPMNRGASASIALTPDFAANHQSHLAFLGEVQDT